VLIAGLSTFIPARRLLREEIIGERRSAPRVGAPPLWARLYLDIAALVAAGAVFQITRINGFHPILNAEGSPTLSLSIYTFLAPLLFWIGSTFLLIRLATGLLRRSSRGLGRFFRPLFGEVGDYAAVTTARRVRAMSETMIVVALALSFGVSTNIFANTYAQQQRVDAELTLGSDVKVTPAAGHAQTDTFTASLARIPGVAAATPFKTTAAYVGTEIQDIFGVDVPSLRRAAILSDAFFQGSNAAETMARLAATPDGILISAEMAVDYSIVNGDHVTIRLFNAARKEYQDARFTVVGVALEFPTAPKDAFLVVNLPALVQATADPSISFFLLKASGAPLTLAQTVQTQLGPGVVQTQTIDSVSAKLATSLTSLDLQGLAGIEYIYTALIASAGLAIFLLALLGERRREFATMRAVGATGRQLAAFVVSEAGLISLGGLVAGALIGSGLAAMLVVILTSIFDPPPGGPIPSYPPLFLLIGLSLGGLALAVGLALTRLRKVRVGDVLRE
jgi:putative ABC transport system permease protein